MRAAAGPVERVQGRGDHPAIEDARQVRLVQHRQERAGRHQPFLLVAKAHQHLDQRPVRGARIDLRDRLAIQHETVALQGAVEVVLRSLAIELGAHVLPLQHGSSDASRRARRRERNV